MQKNRELMMNAEEIRILLVEDKSSDGHIASLLSDTSGPVRFNLTRTNDPNRAIDLLGQDSFEMAVFDVKFPENSEILKKARRQSKDIPLLVTTASEDEETALQAIEDGADDYLVRGSIYKDVLIRSIRYAIARRREQQRACQEQTRLLEELKVTNTELKDFAYIVSHDLKAPLRGIKTIAGWIAKDYSDKLDDEGRQQIDLLISRVERMHNLIDGVLTYSRVGRIREEYQEVNLDRLVPEIIDSLEPGGKAQIIIEGHLPKIVCEPTRIQQVFQNLISNAVKSIDKPRGQIRIGCTEKEGFWRFYVCDNGCGIEPRHFERIFQIFQTLQPRDEAESTGVGLAVTKKIVEMYGGKIWVESELGKGSTFFFTIPTCIDACDNPADVSTKCAEVPKEAVKCESAQSPTSCAI